jgi:nucleotide-binding universal stress UspA family protein
MSYRKIVAGIDGSATAQRALAAAELFAKRFRARLVLVCAFDPPATSKAVAETALQRGAEHARRSRVEVIPELARGEASAAILEAAQQHGADLIVVGNKGIGPATRLGLGGVPDRVAHAMPCDVLIADTTKRPRSTGAAYRSLLAGTDGSATASEAARRAFELAAMFGGAVTLVHAGDPIVGAIHLEGTAATRPDDVEVKVLPVVGEPARQLLEIADRERSDLIVVGNRGMAGLRRLLGSVPNEVAHGASTDVLIVRTVDRTVDDIAPGHGALVDVGGRRLAVYRDEGGRTAFLSPRCTHLGCSIDWNDAEGTWDCPCHGSRFAADGAVLKGPAQKPLERTEGPARR